MEPAIYVDVIKTCPFCESTNAVFKFLNNKSIEQPRYKCLGCLKYFTHNPNSRRRKHPQGYTKAAQNNRPVSQVQDLHDNATVVCSHPECGKVGVSKFLYYNNGKLTQPRYKCGACKTSFTQGGRLRLQRKSEVDAVLHVGESCGSETIIGQPWVLGNANKKMKLSSRKREFDDSSDESEEEIGEDEMAWLHEMCEMDRKRRIMIELASQDEDSDEEECEEPIEFVDVVKPCNWCKSSSTTIHKVLEDGRLWEYQCEDCGGYLKFDGETQSVLPIARQSQNTRYNLRCMTTTTNQIVTL